MHWPFLAIYLAAINATAIVAFALDKRRARRGRWRTRERTLHVVELLGGWPASLLAMRLFRHKTRDRRYRWVQIGIIALHLTIIGVVAWLRLAPA